MEAVCWCAAKSLLLWTTYRFGAQTRRCSFRYAFVSFLRGRQQRRASLWKNKHTSINDTHQVFCGQSASDMWRIMNSAAAAAAAPACPPPAAQPSSFSITVSWPHGGAMCSEKVHMRLCNIIVTANGGWWKWPKYYKDVLKSTCSAYIIIIIGNINIIVINI